MFHSFRILLLSIVLCAWAASTASAQEHDHGDAGAGHAPPVTESVPEEAPLPLTNTMCPVLTDEEVEPEIFTDYEGRRVYLCCQKCLKKFRAEPSAYLGNLPPLRVSTDEAQERGDHAHPEAEEHDDAEEEEEHGHEHGEGGGDAAVGLIEWLGRYHPMVVHFPIGLLVAAAFAELLALLGRGERFSFVARFCLWGGALAAVAAALLGWADAIEMAREYTGFSAKLLLYHRWLGVTTAGVSLLTLWAGERVWRARGGRGKGLYRGLLLLTVLLVSVVGHLGASLIYGWEFLAL
ncbi:MAG TPA: hypothetical protein ENJ09_14140 [Planctomycetes bacterium]|nr:hypothetical protein [Planctomycetota bacterium]